MNYQFQVIAPIEVEALTSSDETNSAIAVCYEAVVQAHQVGADVTELLRTLNKAIVTLSEGNRDASEEMLEGFLQEAEVRMEEAIQKHYSDLLTTALVSFSGISVVLIGGLAFWRLSRRIKSRTFTSISPDRDPFTFVLVIGILMLLAASPIMSRWIVLPRTKFFTEIWILDSNRTAEEFPFIISPNQEYTSFLRIQNQLGYPAYYHIKVKFQAQIQTIPDSLTSSPSNSSTLLNITALVNDEEQWERPLIFNLNYSIESEISTIQFDKVWLNNSQSDISSYTTMWDQEENGYYSHLFFELWIFDQATRDFEYHNRYVSLKMNMTS